MTYAQLRAFHAVAVVGSFQKAAERLRLTQPAISIQVRNLEQENATNLFRRGGQEVSLTEDGQALFALTVRMFGAEADARLLLSGGAGGPAHALHLGADGPHVALDLISALQRVAPDARVRVSLANADQTWAKLHALEVDAAIMANARPDRRHAAEVICRQSLMALVQGGHALSGRDSIALEELADGPLIFRESGSNTQRIIERGFAAQGIAVTPFLVLESREAVKEAVMSGLGIGFLFDREVGRDPRCAGIRIRGFENTNTDMLICLKEQRSNPMVDALFGVLGSERGTRCSDGLSAASKIQVWALSTEWLRLAGLTEAGGPH